MPPMSKFSPAVYSVLSGGVVISMESTSTFLTVISTSAVTPPYETVIFSVPASSGSLETEYPLVTIISVPSA